MRWSYWSQDCSVYKEVPTILFLVASLGLELQRSSESIKNETDHDSRD